MKTRWAREEILGKRLYWLLTVTYAGQAIRIASEDLSVASVDGDLHFYGGLISLRYSEAVSLWDVGIQPTTGEVAVIMPSGVSVAALTEMGHHFGAARIELAQWYDGLAWEDRRVVVVGKAGEPSYGTAEEPVEFGIVQDVYTDAGQIPEAEAEVNADTWNDTYLNSADLGIAYPRVYGYPGKTPRSIRSGTITGSQACWVSKATYHHKLLIADGKVEATSVLINHDGDTNGEPVNVTTAVDDRGRTVTIVDFDAEDYDYNAPGSTPGAFFLGADYVPTSSENVEIFVGWPNGGGLLGPGGSVIRDAGDVIEDVLSFSSLKLDRNAFSSAKPRFAWFKVDGVIDTPVTPWEWLSTELLPLLPVSLVTGPGGVYPVVWDHNATDADMLAVIDADADGAIEVGRVETTGSEIRNDLAITYGYSMRTGEFNYTARLGPAYVAPTGKASGVLTTALGNVEIVVFALAEGPAGQGVRVTLTDTGVLGITDSAATKTVAITYIGATSTKADIVGQIQTSALIDCEDSTSATVWLVNNNDLTLYLQDTGTRGSPACAYSQDRYRTDEDDGVRTWSAETSYVYDDATADGILGWMAAAFAVEARSVQVLLPDDRWGWLALGDVVGFTFSGYALDRRVCIVTEIEWMDDGLVGVRLALVENTARDWALA